LSLYRGDACAVGFADRSFDAVTIAFGIRNLPDVPAALREMHRVLRPGGRALILEFSLPANRLIRAGYLTYFRHVLPAIGRMVSGDAHAYRYLNASVEDFPYGEAFASLMRDAGFASVRAETLTSGVATLYIGER
jgi:demethylmenaquinone methyltransferase/2-methoxy-6-polyprenyl-1,4-benzoquinol methylase